MATPRFSADFGSGMQVIPPPRNWRDTKLECLFTNDFPSATVQAINYEWVKDNAKSINSYIAAGLAGGTGIGEGIPLQIDINGYVIFSGIIDLANASTEIECDMIKAPIKKIGSIDWFMDMAESIPFSLLVDTGIISPPLGDPNYNPSAKYFYKKVPYSITFRDWEQGLFLLLEEFSLIQHIYQAVNETINDITNIGGTATAAGTIAGAPAAVPMGVAEIISIAADIVYDSLLIIELVSLTETLINQTVGVKKYKYAMTAIDAINAGIYYMNQQGGVPPGLTFKSSILQGTGYGGIYANTTIMPKKNIKVTLGSNLIPPFLGGKAWGALTFGNEAWPNTVGPPYGHPDSNLKKLFQDLIQVFNGSVKIIGNQVQFEEQHYWNNIAIYTMPNTGKPGNDILNYPAPYGTNWNELTYSYLLKFLTDSGDEMTIKNYKGTTCQVQIQPKIVKNVLNLTPPPATEKDFPFALAKRKEEYNVAEQVVNDLLTAVQDVVNTLLWPINAVINGINSIISLFGGSVNTIPNISVSWTMNRIGWLEVSNDSWQEPKIFIGTQVGSDWQIISDYVPAGVPQFSNSAGQPENAMSAIALMGTPANSQFHGLNLMSRGNQWLLYKSKEIPFCLSDFKQIINNNIFKTADKVPLYGKFEKFQWDVYNEKATNVEYRVNKQYTNNYNESITVDGQ